MPGSHKDFIHLLTATKPHVHGCSQSVSLSNLSCHIFRKTKGKRRCLFKQAKNKNLALIRYNLIKLQNKSQILFKKMLNTIEVNKYCWLKFWTLPNRLVHYLWTSCVVVPELIFLSLSIPFRSHKTISLHFNRIAPFSTVPSQYWIIGVVE